MFYLLTYLLTVPSIQVDLLTFTHSKNRHQAVNLFNTDRNTVLYIDKCKVGVNGQSEAGLCICTGTVNTPSTSASWS